MRVAASSRPQVTRVQVGESSVMSPWGSMLSNTTRASPCSVAPSTRTGVSGPRRTLTSLRGTSAPQRLGHSGSGAHPAPSIPFTSGSSRASSSPGGIPPSALPHTFPTSLSLISPATDVTVRTSRPLTSSARYSTSPSRRIREGSPPVDGVEAMGVGGLNVPTRRHPDVGRMAVSSPSSPVAHGASHRVYDTATVRAG